jgi:hemerythrin-like domain-containing protein
MAAKKRKSSEIRDINLIDILLIDHRYIKECIDVLISDKADKTLKFNMAKSFLQNLQQHSEVEKKTVYAPLEKEEEFHFNILEAEIEHGIMDEKIKLLKPKLARAKVLKDEIEVELKVLAEIVKKHIMEEESEILPKMNQELDEETLMKMGKEFMQARKMTAEDLKDYPHLDDELVTWKDDVQKVSSKFLSKVDKYVENLRH